MTSEAKSIFGCQSSGLLVLDLTNLEGKGIACAIFDGFFFHRRLDLFFEDIELLWLDEGLSTGTKVLTMSGDRIRKHRFSSLMQKCLARLRMKRLERTVFRSAFPSPVGSGLGWAKNTQRVEPRY